MRATRSFFAMLPALGCSALVAVCTAPAALSDEPNSMDKPFCVLDEDTGESGCYATREDQTMAISDGRTADERELMQKSSKVIHGRFFTGRDYGGNPSLTVFGKGLCNPADGKINYSKNFPRGWRHVITSAEPFGNCKIWLYPSTYLRGRRDGPYERDTSYVGDYMNNNSESVGFS